MQVTRNPGSLAYHPAADIFPHMTAEDVAELAEDIREHGQREPIWVTHDWQVIDGRHRCIACAKLGIDVDCKVFDGADDAIVPFVVSLNLRRRHLSVEQRSMVAERIANLKLGDNQHTTEGLQICRPSVADAARQMNVSERSVHTARKIRSAGSPSLISAVEAGTTSLSAAAEVATLPVEEQEEVVARGEKEIVRKAAEIKKAKSVEKKRARKAAIEEQAKAIEQGIEMPTGEYDVVVMDPPWAYGREYDPDGSRVANPYPEMAQAELLAISVPAKKDSCLFLWTTHKFIWDAKALLDAWGFDYKATLVWDKEALGMGAWLRMQCEFCLVGIKGKPYWENTQWRDIIREKRREHSRKPEGFYELVEAVTAGTRLDYFSRSKRDGWECFGNDTERF